MPQTQNRQSEDDRVGPAMATWTMPIPWIQSSFASSK